MTAEDLAPEPARSIRERIAAMEAAAALGGRWCSWCLSPIGRKVRGRAEHPACTAAFLAGLRHEAETIGAAKAALLAKMNATMCRIEVEGTFNGKRHTLQVTAFPHATPGGAPTVRVDSVVLRRGR